MRSRMPHALLSSPAVTICAYAYRSIPPDWRSPRRGLRPARQQSTGSFSRPVVGARTIVLRAAVAASPVVSSLRADDAPAHETRRLSCGADPLIITDDPSRAMSGSAVNERFAGSGAGSAPSGFSAFLKTFDPLSTCVRCRQANPTCAVQRRATTQERSRHTLRLRPLRQL